MSVIEMTDAVIKIAQEEYERGFIDGMQEQMKTSVDRAVNAMCKREWVGLTDEEIWSNGSRLSLSERGIREFARAIEAKLKEKNQ